MDINDPEPYLRLLTSDQLTGLKSSITQELIRRYKAAATASPVVPAHRIVTGNLAANHILTGKLVWPESE